MPITYTIDHADRLIYVTFDGPVTGAELFEHWQAFMSDPPVLDIRRSIADLRGATLEFGYEELRTLIAEVLAPHLSEAPFRTAVVVASPTTFGVSRQYQALMSTLSDDSIFTDYDEALAWIRTR
jgi:hypothetical protein